MGEGRGFNAVRDELGEEIDFNAEPRLATQEIRNDGHGVNVGRHIPAKEHGLSMMRESSNPSVISRFDPTVLWRT